MEKLIIKNVGPIKDAELDLNKVNVFIGPQSSGKSTIAKMISFCRMVKRDIINYWDFKHIDTDFVKRGLFEYWELENYFDGSSYFKYENDILSFEWSRNQFRFVKNQIDMQNARLNTLLYIPAERVLVGVRNIMNLELGQTYLRDFLFNWFTRRDKYDQQHAMPLLNLNMQYYFDKNGGDTFELEDGKRLGMGDMSSGVQSLTPILIDVDYVTKWIYEHQEGVSYNKYSLLKAAQEEEILKRVDRDGKRAGAINWILDSVFTQGGDIDSVKNSFSKDDFQVLKDVKQSLDNVLRTQYTNLVVEEPELNIFPKTQYELVKSMIGSMNFERGDSLVLTTHSPYIMSSLNNLIEGDNALKVVAVNEDLSDADKMKAQSEIYQMIPEQSALPYEYVSAWMVENGTIRSINDDEYRLISADALDSVSDVIGDEYNKLLDYEC